MLRPQVAGLSNALDFSSLQLRQHSLFLAMVMEGRRLRRFGRGRQQNIQTLLPLRLTRLSNTVSCWYCDFKSTVLNEPLFRFGRKYSRCLRVWFSSGIGFSLSALLGVTLILIWELGRALHLFDGSEQLSRLLSGSRFGFSTSISGLSISLPDIGYVCISSILSVFVHEVGHALAAASEGVQMEYIAVFLAGLFPGALVAFDYEELQELPRFATLRVYCAGIWHNAAVVLCGLFLGIVSPALDFGSILHTRESPTVLDVSPVSPLSGYLSPRDLIISLGGIRIHNVQQWKEIIALSNERILQYLDNAKDFEDFTGINERKGYCVPYYLIEGSMPASAQVEGNKTTCANDLFAFAAIPCLDSHVRGNISNEFNNLQGRGWIHCFNPKDVIKLKRCGDIGKITLSNSTSCPCLEDESCFTPVQMPGLAWTEITYWSPSLGCDHPLRNLFQEYKSTDLEEMGCARRFVFVGDLISLEKSLHLTSYRPRASFDIGAHLPNILEKLLICTFHVSLTLALLNSLPVYFLDGECIVEVILQYIGFLLPRTREIFLQWFLLGGTFISILAFLWVMFVILSE